MYKVGDELLVFARLLRSSGRRECARCRDGRTGSRQAAVIRRSTSSSVGGQRPRLRAAPMRPSTPTWPPRPTRRPSPG